jgi:glycine oxidase
MAQHPDVLILGGGVIGLTVAFYLAREGVTVEVLDCGDLGQESSWAGAGIIPPGSLPHARSPLELLLGYSSATFPVLSEELRECTGIDNGYLRCGGIEVVEDAESHARALRSLGVKVEVLTPAAWQSLEPALSGDLGSAVCRLPDMAQVRNPRHMKALVTACAHRGVRLRPGCPVYGLEQRGAEISCAVTPAGRLAAGRYLVAAGAWSESLLEPLGWRPGLHPVRGQIALLNTASSRFRHIVEEGKRYLVPRPDGRVLVGSTEEQVGFDRRTTAAAIRDLLDFATRLVPDLAAAHLERSWAGLRPGSPDGLPFLGPVPGIDNLFVAAGHFRAGIQLSPATGLVLSECLRGLPPSLPIEAFALDRTALGS